MKQSTQTGKPHAAAAHVLREQSPTVVAHLSEGCTTCAAGLQVFRQDAPEASHQAVLELFERELFTTFQASGNAVQALHAALAGVVTTQRERAAD